jgi:hypothetical protein
MSQGTGLNRHVVDFRLSENFHGLDEMNISHFSAGAVIYNFASLSAWLDRISAASRRSDTNAPRPELTDLQLPPIPFWRRIVSASEWETCHTME